MQLTDWLIVALELIGLTKISFVKNWIWPSRKRSIVFSSICYCWPSFESWLRYTQCKPPDKLGSVHMFKNGTCRTTMRKAQLNPSFTVGKLLSWDSSNFLACLSEERFRSLMLFLLRCPAWKYRLHGVMWQTVTAWGSAKIMIITIVSSFVSKYSVYAFRLHIEK